MFVLNTLGSLQLVDAAGEPVDAVLAQPKRALLLAYLASAPPRGFHRRDLLLALFWPELDSERARGALRKSLHFLRASLGDAIITLGDGIGVEPALLRCDAVAFERAESEGALVEAMALYRGPFLPGFYAREAPDVERWIEAERVRLAALAARTAWALAERSIGDDAAAAAAWSARAFSFTPEDEGALRRRMTLLQRAGDPGGALRAYDDFAASLADAFPDASPSPLTTALRGRLLEPRPAPAAPRHSPAPAMVPAPAPPAPIAPVPGVASRAPRARRVAMAAGAAVAVALLGLLAARRASSPAPLALEADPMRTVAVLPFTTRGAAIGYLREGMVDLLSIQLQGAGDLRAVDATALLGASAADTATGDLVARGRAMARRFHAGRFVLGTVVNGGSRLEARANLYATDDSSGTPLGVVSATAEAGDVVRLSDDLAREILAAMLGAREPRLSRLATGTTRSLPALKDYLRGAQAMRVGDYRVAADAFESATRADTGFALAYYGWSMALGWASEGADRRATITAGMAAGRTRGLSAHDSLLVVAHFHSWAGAAVDAEREYRYLVAAYPTDVEAWHELGEVIFHNGVINGHPMAHARDAFTRASPVPALRMSALVHLARLAAVTRDTLALDTLARDVRAEAPRDVRAAEVLALRTFTSGDPRERAAAIAAAAALDDRALARLAQDVRAYTGAWEDAEALARLLTAPARAASVRADGWSAIAGVRAAAGRPVAAANALDTLERLDAARGVAEREYLRSLPFLGGAGPAPGTTAAAGPPWPDALAAAAPLAPGARMTAAEARARLRILQRDWRMLHADPTAKREGLIRLGRATLHRAAGDDAEALRWLATFPAYGWDDAVYRAPAALARAAAADATGDRAAAAQAYAEAAWLWRAAEPPLLPSARAAGARARALRAR